MRKRVVVHANGFLNEELISSHHEACLRIPRHVQAQLHRARGQHKFPERGDLSEETELVGCAVSHASLDAAASRREINQPRAKEPTYFEKSLFERFRFLNSATTLPHHSLRAASKPILLSDAIEASCSPL